MEMLLQWLDNGKALFFYFRIIASSTTGVRGDHLFSAHEKAQKIKQRKWGLFLSLSVNTLDATFSH